MNQHNCEHNRPFVCPGCSIDLPTDRDAALAHMTQCTPLQVMIAIGKVQAHELPVVATPPRETESMRFR